MGAPRRKTIVVVTKARVMHLLAVFVITPASGVIAGLLAKTVLPHYTSVQIELAMLGGASWALGLAFHYLRQNAWFEKNVEPYIDVVDGVAKPAEQLAVDHDYRASGYVHMDDVRAAIRNELDAGSRTLGGALK